MENFNKQENKEMVADCIKIIIDPGEKKLLKKNFNSEKRIWFVLTQSLELYLGADGHAPIYYKNGLSLYSEIDGCFINLPEYKGGNTKNFEFRPDSQRQIKKFLKENNNLASSPENLKKIIRDKIINFFENKN